MVEAFREVCDACPALRVSLEFKPTDENTRFFAVPSTGAALLLVKDIDRPNMGLTIDVGHCLAAGENPAQSVAMVGVRKVTTNLTQRQRNERTNERTSRASWPYRLCLVDCAASFSDHTMRHTCVSCVTVF